MVLAGAVVNANASLHAGVLVNSGVNAAMAGGSRLAPLACLGLGAVLGCVETRFAALELSPVSSDPRGS